ncbi:hypothetical protein ACTMTJ_42870 [Phytohabitans sp. LJ34]|uniref:hypothetical protein n=1 Tax=Phytohabitans sp. LJ34 TaxID=3452217 RepID=UPI003F8A1B69
MADRSVRGTGVLAAAAVIAGLTAVTLVAVGFWLRGWVLASDDLRFGDVRWWLSLLSQVGGYLLLGKGGFKIGLAVVLGASGILVWLRERRRRRPDATPPPPEPGPED